MRRVDRLRRERNLGFALIAAALLGFAAMLGGAYYVDSARGVSVSASLSDWGL